MTKKVLVLGAGMVSGPCVGYLLQQQYHVTVVSAIQVELDCMATLYPKAQMVNLDVVNTQKLQDFVNQHDIVVCLLPAHLNHVVASCCIEGKRNLVHASYEDEAIRSLHENAVAAGINILSEVGLDPGIDHMLVMNCIDSIRENGGQITGYMSLCGGIPAPDYSHGPLRYKFSWYPKGMFISAMKEARYIKDGQDITIQAGHIFDNPVIVDDLIRGCEFENVPNRDSTTYRKVYDIQSVSNIYRGTLRYKGFSAGMRSLISLGLVSNDVLPQLIPGSASITWRELLCTLLELPLDSTQENILRYIQSKHGLNQTQADIVTDLDLLSDEQVPKLNTPLDALCSLLTSKLAYGSDEQDMVVIRSIIQARFPNGQTEQHTFDFVVKGQPQGYSAMARTVGLTAAMSACLLMKGATKRPGAILPVTQDIYKPVLEMLAKEGIHVESKIIKGSA